MIDKHIILQCPNKYVEMIPIFYKFANPYFDYFHIWVNSDKKTLKKIISITGNNVILYRSNDNTFTGNIRYVLDKIISKTNFVFFSCEDMIILNIDKNKFDSCIKFSENRKKFGVIGLVSKGDARCNFKIIKNIHKKRISVSTYLSLWNSKFLRTMVSEDMSGANFEKYASSVARKQNIYNCYIADGKVCTVINFIKNYKGISGYRECTVNFCNENNINLTGNFPVAVKHRKNGRRVYDFIPFNEYIKNIK